MLKEMKYYQPCLRILFLVELQFSLVALAQFWNDINSQYLHYIENIQDLYATSL